MPTTFHGVVADVGGTNTRFGTVSPGGIENVRLLKNTDHKTLASAVRGYMDEMPHLQSARGAAIAIAGPIIADWVDVTNYPAWSFSQLQLKEELELDRLRVINDFEAVAAAIPHLIEGDRIQIGDGTPGLDKPIAVLGAGTGLGVSSLVRTDRGWTVVPGEGGHATMPAVSDQEAAILSRIRLRYGHASAERVISGPGLGNLYEELGRLDGKDPPSREPSDISASAISASDETCMQAVAMFCAMLGTFAGNLALTVGARGGVYIAGGVVPQLGKLFIESEFRSRFEEKGRFREYLRPIPTYLITHNLPAFVGLRSELEDAD